MYIGNTPAENYASFLTETFTVSATTNYTLSHAVTNENDIRLVINGVVQQPGSGKAYTASGTTLTLTSATVSGDSMYAVYLGRALQTVNPPNASVGSAQIADSLISGKTALGATPADTDEFLVSDAGTLKRIDYSLIKGGGITVADQFRVTANITSNVDPISANIERIDTAGQGGMTDNQMSVSSGIFTFPLTRIYLVSFNAYGVTDSDGDNLGMYLKVTTNNSSYTGVASSFDGNQGSKSISVTSNSLIDVTDTSNVKVSFQALSLDSGSYFVGDTSGTTNNETFFTFIRLGDT